MSAPDAPVVLPSNRPAARFYAGGRRITDLRGDPPAASHEPEDWIASATHVFGQPGVGETVLEDGGTLADAVREDPEGWLGAAHVAAFGADTALLTKLLDAGQRLPVHAHPDGAFAAAHLGRAHGKTEAWIVLAGGTVHVGLRRDVDAASLRALVDRQDAAGLLGLLNPIEVGPGDGVLVPAGQLHAIGEDVFVLEVQEPEDLSILLEWDGFDLDGPRDGHLGLGLDAALTAVSTERLAVTDALVHRASTGSGRMLPPTADPFFSVDRVVVDGSSELEPGFAVLVVLEGEATVSGVLLGRGATAVVPHRVGPLRVTGAATLLVARPPRPDRVAR